MSPPGRRPLLGVLTIGLGASIAPMDFAVNVALPAITAAFSLDVSSIRWVVISYVLTYASLMLAFGKLGDAIGHRRVFRAGLVVGAFAFLGCGLAPSYPWLLAARAVQGVATALVLSCAPALVVACSGDQHRTWALSRYGMTAALAGIVGPLLGGLSGLAVGWSGAFWFRVPVSLAALLLLAWLPQSDTPDEPRQRLDVASSVLLAAGLAFVLGAPALSPDAATPALPASVALLGALLLGGFAARERASSEPFLPRAVLRDRSVLLANATSIATQFTGFAINLLVPYYLARVAGLDSAMIGVMLAMSTTGQLVGASIAPRVMHQVGQRTATLSGALVVALAQVCISLWPLHPPAAILVTGLLLHGVGLGLFQVSYSDLIVAALPRHSRGIAGSLTMLTRTIGVVVAAVVLGSGLQTFESGHLAAGRPPLDAFHAAFGTMFLISAAGLAGIVALVWWRWKAGRSR